MAKQLSMDDILADKPVLRETTLPAPAAEPAAPPAKGRRR